MRELRLGIWVVLLELELESGRSFALVGNYLMQVPDRKFSYAWTAGSVYEDIFAAS